MPKPSRFSAQQIALAKSYARREPGKVSERVEALVTDLIGRVADKWTMLILEVLVEHGELRFTRIRNLVGGISQKMLTQTLRQMEREGLVTRTVHPVVPPRVEYELTGLGMSLGGAFCGVWVWASENLKAVERARTKFDKTRGSRQTRRAGSVAGVPLHSGTNRSRPRAGAAQLWLTQASFSKESGPRMRVQVAPPSGPCRQGGVVEPAQRGALEERPRLEARDRAVRAGAGGPLPVRSGA